MRSSLIYWTNLATIGNVEEKSAPMTSCEPNLKTNVIKKDLIEYCKEYQLQSQLHMDMVDNHSTITQ